MLCFICLTQDDSAAAACVICVQCGVALCQQHAVAGHAFTEVHSMGSPVPHRLPGRRFYCPDCAQRS